MVDKYISDVEGGELTNPTGTEKIETDNGTISQWLKLNTILPVAATDTNDIFQVGNVGSSGWTGTINGTPSGTSVNYTHVSGNQNTLVPASTSQLGKQRLYNTTRGNYARISNSTGAGNITLDATVPANWAAGDTITTLSPTVASAGWVDIEITSGTLVNKKNGFFLFSITDSGAIGQILNSQEFGPDTTSRRSALVTQSASSMSAMYLKKIISNVISIFWSASGAATCIIVIREMGYIP